MKRNAVSDKPPDHGKTMASLHQAIDEVQHAARPSRRSSSAVLSWLVALGAGALVAWRSARARVATEETESNLTPARSSASNARSPRSSRRDGPSSAAPRHADRHERRPTKPIASRKDEDNAEADACPAKVEGFIPLAKELWCRFQTDECLTRSQALAFIGVLSLGPLLLFALAALGFVIHDAAQVERYVHDLVGQLLPGRQASQAANNLIAQTHLLEAAQTLMRGKWWAVSIGVISLIWAAIGLFTGASDPMNAAWNVRETRGFLALRAICFGVFLLASVLFLLSLVPSSLPSLVGRMNLPLIGSLPRGAWWIELIAWVLAIVIDAAMFTVIYRFLPNASVTWKSALAGGAAAGFLWELFKKGFAVYLAHFANYDKLYGTLGGAVLLVTWIWYSCVLLLVGCIIGRMYKEHVEDGGVMRMEDTGSTTDWQ